MKNILPILLLALLMVSCNKEKQKNKSINGNWEPVSLKITKPTGLTYYVTASGELSFSANKKSNNGSYTLNMSFTFEDSLYNFSENGSYEINGEILTRTFNGISNESRIVYINEKDFEFEIQNFNNQGYFYILKRKE